MYIIENTIKDIFIINHIVWLSGNAPLRFDTTDGVDRDHVSGPSSDGRQSQRPVPFPQKSRVSPRRPKTSL